MKRAAILFDHIVVAFAVVSRDVHSLQDSRILIDPAEIAAEHAVRRPLDLVLMSSSPDILDPGARDDLSILRMDDTTRAFASALNDVSPYRLVPLLDHPRSLRQSPTQQNPHAVTHIVLNHLPLPSDDTPWEAIVDWRNDVDARIRYRRLKRWMHDVSRSALTAREIIDTMGTLLDDYTTYVALHHKKMARGRVRVILNSVSGALIHGIQGQLSAVLTDLLALFTESTTLLEAELNAPGREIAYVVEAHERFSA